MTERRAQRLGLVSFVTEELDQFDRGEIGRISSPEEVRERFGFAHTSSMYRPLLGTGLVERRRMVLDTLAQQEVESYISPSPEWAWTLATLSLGGNVSPMGKIRLTHCKDIEVRDKFVLLGENLFARNTGIIPVREANRAERNIAEYNSVTAARAIGDLSGEKWIETIKNKHGWILEDPQFTWRFLEGLFEIRGYASSDISKDGIQFMTSSLAVANFITSILSRVGIENVGLRRRKKLKDGIMGIRITRLPDAIFFAQQIHSVVPEKEERLEIYRQKVPTREYKVIADDELISEWQRLTRFLGHAPTWNELRRLREAQEIEHFPDIYSRHFGQTEVDGIRIGASFILAKQNLEALLALPQILKFDVDTPEDVLVNEAIRGDNEAFGMLYENYHDRIFRYILYRVINPEVAEDLTQEAFVHAWRAIDRYRVTEAPFVAWIYTISHNQVISYYRRDHQTVPLEISFADNPESTMETIQNDDMHTNPEEEILLLTEREGMKEKVREAIETLKPESQQVVNMRLANASHRDIAEFLGKSEGNVRQIYSRALDELRTFLEIENKTS